MSLINKMLRELDKRHATQAAASSPSPGPGATLTQHLRPVKERTATPWIWGLASVLVLVAIGLGAWLAWNLSPRWNVLDRASAPITRASAPAAPVAVVRGAQAPGMDAPAPAPGVDVSSQTTATATAPEANAPVAAPEPQAAATPPFDLPKPDVLQMTTQLTVPMSARELKAAAPQKERASRSREVAVLTVPAAESPAAKAETAPSRKTPAVSDSGRIDRRSDVTPRERAESEYRRAMGFVNQGRIAEGMDGMRNALQIDSGHETARQTLVSLMFDAKRIDEARAVIQEGLALNPANTGFAMLLARIITERGDVAGALAVLQKHAPSKDTNADYHAFAGALHQRLGRHGEAIAEYQAALRLAPSTGIWWVGLGISLQAAERPREALEAYQRAKGSGSLAPDLVAFVDQRMRQLR